MKYVDEFRDRAVVATLPERNKKDGASYLETYINRQRSPIIY